MYYRIRAAAILSPVVVIFSTPITALSQTASDEADADIEAIVVVGTQLNMESELAEIELTPGGVSLLDMDDSRAATIATLAACPTACRASLTMPPLYWKRQRFPL